MREGTHPVDRFAMDLRCKCRLELVLPNLHGLMTHLDAVVVQEVSDYAQRHGAFHVHRDYEPDAPRRRFELPKMALWLGHRLQIASRLIGVNSALLTLYGYNKRTEPS